uniref:hypothetical protein n=1 Tax=Arthrobacter sp. TaxID=1667 RepID=UPI003A8FCF6F
LAPQRAEQTLIDCLRPLKPIGINHLGENADGVFEVTTVASRDEAVESIQSRDAYGAIILGAQPEVLDGGANGAAITQILKGVSQQLQGQLSKAAGAAHQAAPQVEFTDIVPLVEADANGAGLALASFPLAMGGMLGGILVSLVVVGNRRRLTTLLVYALLGGVVITVFMQGMYGVLQGNALLNVLAAGLALLGTSSLIVGLNALIGTPGIPVGALLTMLVANPISGANVPSQFLPGPSGVIGQWFVPGASTNLLKDISYFPTANSTFFWLVLAGWALLGVVFTLAGHFRNQEVVHVEGSTDADAATPEAGKHAKDVAPDATAATAAASGAGSAEAPADAPGPHEPESTGRHLA